MKKILRITKVMTEAEAEQYLYCLWEEGQVPSNFTCEHSEFERAIERIMELGELPHDEFF